MQTSKIIKAVVLGMLITFFPLSLFAEQKSGLQLSEEEQAWVHAHPLLTVANEMEWPPFDFVDAGEPQGYSIDLIRLIAKKIGWKLKFVNGFTWEELLTKFKAGEIDVIPAIFMSDERKKFTAFTKKYLSQPSILVVQKGNLDIVDVDSLAGKRVVGIVGAAISDALRSQVPSIKFIPVENAIDGIKAVSLGEADAMVNSIGVVTHILENNFIPNVKTIANVNLGDISNPALHIGVGKDKEILRDILDKALSSLSREEKHRLNNHWLQMSAGGKKIELTHEQQVWIDSHPIIRIGIDSDYAPYSFLDKSGHYRGIALDFIRTIGQRLGIKFEVVPNLSWPEIIEGSQKRTIDVIATTVATRERRMFLNFTPIYLKTPLVIMTRADDNRIVSPEDLEGLKVALVKKYSTSLRVVEEHAGAQPIWATNPTEGLRLVATGVADAYVGVLGVNIYLGRKNGITNLKVASRYDNDTNGQRIAVRSDWPELALLMDKALESISEEERISINDKWIRFQYEETTDYSLLSQSIAIFFIIIALLYFYIRKLVKEVERRKVAEKELQVTNRAAIEAKKMADGANASKSTFLANMSHELRTPMNAILGFGQLLKLSEKEPLSDFQANNVGRILKAGQHLLGLIDEVLDLSRIESGSMPISIEDVNLFYSMDLVLPLMEPKAKELNVEIENHLDSSLFVRADPTRLMQVLLNLVSNAVKYNKPGGRVTLNCETTLDKRVRINVIDTGRGIPEAKQKLIFEPFNRLGAESTKIEGTGIGLTITKHLVELMKGSLDVESVFEQGSCFTLELPMGTNVKCKPQGKKMARSIEATEGHEYTVLYVEDNPDNMELVRVLLSEQKNIKFLSATHAKEGITLARTHRPQLILMDINLPDMNGIEALEKLKSFDETREIPVIAVSANAMKADISRAMEAGFTDYMVKPIDLLDFKRTIDKVLNKEAS